nr:competence type IV pilus minor pilin ComGF [Cytobacillus citreus]
MNTRSVKYLNNRGFTMLEMLYAFSIFLLIVSFFPLCMKYLLDNEGLEARVSRMEWQVFVSQLKKELRLSEGLEVYENKVILRKNGQNVIYEKYGTNLRRRVNYEGHEIVLQKVDTFNFTPIQDGMKLTVKDLYHQSHSALLFSYIELEEENAAE